MQTAPYGGAQVCAWTCKTPLNSVGATARRRAGAKQRAATTQTPRRPIGAGGVRGARRSGSASVITTHALFARKVQRKLSNGVAGFAAGRIIFGPTCARGRGMLAAGPELRITGAAAQTRMVSVARIRLVSRKSTRLFKGIICDDISEFESYMPSHAVGSLWGDGDPKRLAAFCGPRAQREPLPKTA